MIVLWMLGIGCTVPTVEPAVQKLEAPTWEPPEWISAHEQCEAAPCLEGKASPSSVEMLALCAYLPPSYQRHIYERYQQHPTDGDSIRLGILEEPVVDILGLVRDEENPVRWSNLIGAHRKERDSTPADHLLAFLASENQGVRWTALDVLELHPIPVPDTLWSRLATTGKDTNRSVAIDLAPHWSREQIITGVRSTAADPIPETSSAGSSAFGSWLERMFQLEVEPIEMKELIFSRERWYVYAKKTERPWARRWLDELISEQRKGASSAPNMSEDDVVLLMRRMKDNPLPQHWDLCREEFAKVSREELEEWQSDPSAYRRAACREIWSRREGRSLTDVEVKALSGG